MVNILQEGGPIRFAVPRASGQVKTASILGCDSCLAIAHTACISPGRVWAQL